MRFLTTWILTILLGANLIACSDDSAVPSYEQARTEFFQQKKAEKSSSGFSKQDYAIMAKSAEKLRQALPNPGLLVGAKAPNFVLGNAYGNGIRLSDVLSKGPVILVFYRGAWCPFCNLHLNTLQKAMPLFEKYQAQLIAVTPQTPDKSLPQINKNALTFEVLSDLDDEVMYLYKMYHRVDDELNEVYRKNGIDIEAYNGAGRRVLPVPGTYIIDQNSVIRGVHADTDYKQRMEVSTILSILEEIQQQ